jgi:uncharacterized protein YodC (DUF2158 family)
MFFGPQLTTYKLNSGRKHQMSDQIAAGSVVQLKSGGPKMTVTKVESWNGVISAHCEWFDGSKPGRDLFPLTALKVVADQPPPSSAGPSGKPGVWS